MPRKGKGAIDWSKLRNALPKPKRLHLEEDEEDGLFHCPVEECRHDGFATQRGCRKHVKKKHLWFFYFDVKPEDGWAIEDAKSHVNLNEKSVISDNVRKSIPTFDTSSKIAKALFAWFIGTGGGCKSQRQARQIVSRCLKYLKFCCEDEEELTFAIVDFGLCSPNLLFQFVDALQGHWKLGHAGRLGYIDAISGMVDFRKVNGASTAVASSLSTTEIYLKKVKGSRPMTYQYLTVDMVEKAKTNGGFIDQKMFKTAGKYGFDSIYLTDTNMEVLQGFVTHIRPPLKPNCDFVLVTRNGGQHSKLGESMSKLVFDATGKYVHPTRYRQIVETASSNKLGSSGQSAISEDQKHSSVVARVHYQKQRSRDVATEAHTCLKELLGDKGTELEMDIRTRLSSKSSSSTEPEEKTDCSNDEGQNVESTTLTPILKKKATHKVGSVGRRKRVAFTQEEDRYLKTGLKRHGFGNWKAIPEDSDFHFQKGRTANSLLSRAARRFPSF